MIRHPALDTREAILDRSLELFNEFGIESVAINRVADSLDISPGNFTYHFRRKTHLLDALIARLEAQMVAGLRDFPYTSGAWSFVRAYADLFTCTWRHRALFNGAPYLILNGLMPAIRFQDLSSHITATLTAQTERLIAQGFMQAVHAPYEVGTLSDCIWWQWLGWLRANQMREASDQIQVEAIVRNGINHCIFLVRPYLRKDYAAKLHRAVQELDLESLDDNRQRGAD